MFCEDKYHLILPLSKKKKKKNILPRVFVYIFAN